MFTLGIDVGGTFTDLVAVDCESGYIRTAKYPSQTDHHSAAILSGMQEFGLQGRDIGRFIHGTTIATNALVERRGAVMGLVTTKGCRDVIEIGRGRRLVEGGMFDIGFRRPEPLVSRELRIEVRERCRATGAVIQPLVREDVQHAANVFKARRVQSVAVCFLHSYKSTEHERAAAALLREQLGPAVYITLSSVVNPQYREFERFSTTVVNGYVGPKVAEYLAHLKKHTSSGTSARSIYVMSSAGGIMDFETAATFPVCTILSGPAGGVTASRLVADEVGVKDVITCDMGGTSTDVALLKDNSPLYANETIVSGVPIRASQLDINTIGAGAGSIIWIDSDQALSVGPKSAGAYPGPACYGNGGDLPTVTDANVVLGRIADNTLLGGRIKVQAALAEKAFGQLREFGGFQSSVAAAEGALAILVAKTARAIREISLQRGFDPRDFALVAFGGAGPMHAADVAESLGIQTVIVPNHAGVLSAVGLSRAEIRRDALATYLHRTTDLDCNDLCLRLEMLQDELIEQLKSDGADVSQIRRSYLLEMRFVGQSHELLVSLGSDLAAVTRDLIERSFRTVYERRYGRHPDAKSEVVQIRVLAEAKVDSTSAHVWRPASSPSPKCELKRVVWFKNRNIPTTVYSRTSLNPYDRFEGPSIVEELGATTVIPPGWRGEVHAAGHLILSAN